jgi:hypothetical protein
VVKILTAYGVNKIRQILMGKLHYTPPQNKVILELCEKDTTNAKGVSPLFAACQAVHISVVKVLVSSGSYLGEVHQN